MNLFSQVNSIHDVLIWVVFTITAYFVALIVYKKSSANPLAHPLITTACIVAIGLWFSDTHVEKFQANTKVIDWLLGPATVALALPLYRQINVIKNLGIGIVLPVLIGGFLASFSAWLIMFIASDNLALQMTMLVKSITTPFAMDVADSIGGLAGLAAVIVITTGIVGAVSAGWLFSKFNISKPAAQGVALGTIAHAIGTSKAVQMGDNVAAMATLALCFNGFLTALVLSLLFAFF